MLKLMRGLKRCKHFFWFLVFMQIALFFNLPAVHAAYGFDGAYKTTAPDLEKKSYVNMQGDSLTVQGQLRVLGNTILNGVYVLNDTSETIYTDTIRGLNHAVVFDTITIGLGADNFDIYMQGDKIVFRDKDNDQLLTLDASNNQLFGLEGSFFSSLSVNYIKNYSGNRLIFDPSAASNSVCSLGGPGDTIKVATTATFQGPEQIYLGPSHYITTNGATAFRLRFGAAQDATLYLNAVKANTGLFDFITNYLTNGIIINPGVSTAGPCTLGYDAGDIFQVHPQTKLVLKDTTWFIDHTSNDYLRWTGTTLEIKNNNGNGGITAGTYNVTGNLNLWSGSSSPIRDADGVRNMIWIGDNNDTVYTQHVYKVSKIIGLDTLLDELVFKKAATFLEIDNGSSGTSKTIDWGSGNKQKILMTDNCTFTFTAPNSPGNFLIKLTQDGGGGNTATWPGTVTWPGGTPPTLSTGGGDVDIVSFYYDGTNYHGQFALDFQ